jgi:dienelactone hydrolase
VPAAGILAVAMLPGVLAAQQFAGAAGSDSLRPGRVVERRAAASDTAEHYALYVPSRFERSRRWPVLFVLDPRGRALVGMELFRGPAEARGWIVMSSYNSVSDSTTEPNERAMNAMLDDAQRLFPVDTSRIYLAGFSGTARLSWLFALALRGHVAGILGFGAGLPNGVPAVRFAPLGTRRFAFFGGAGTEGFNYDEVLRLEPELAGLGITARIATYPGPHAWAPAEIVARGVAWLDLQAMRGGLRPVEDAFVDSLLAAERGEARRREGAGDPYGALRAYRAVVSDFSGLRDVAAERERADRLARSPAVRHHEERVRKLLAETREYRLSMVRTLMAARDESPPPDTRTLARRLELDSLQARASGADSLDAAYARRMLAGVAVETRFYEPRAYLAAGKPDRALAVLGLAERLAPGSPDVCWFRARALAEARRPDEAFEALSCALRGGIPPRRLSDDPYLASLRADPRWRALLGGDA